MDSAHSSAAFSFVKKKGDSLQTGSESRPIISGCVTKLSGRGLGVLVVMRLAKLKDTGLKLMQVDKARRCHAGLLADLLKLR